MAKKARAGLSIKYKLLILLTVIPIVALGIYALVAIDLFRKDKVAYVFDSSSAISKSLSSQISAELNKLSSYVRPYLAGYLPSQKRFTDESKLNLKDDVRVEWLSIYHYNGNSFELGGSIKKPSFAPKVPLQESIIRLLVNDTDREQLIVEPFNENQVVFVFRNGEVSDPNRTIVFSVLNANEIKKAFEESGAYKNYLLNAKGKVLFGDTEQRTFAKWPFFAEVAGQDFSERTIESVDPQDQVVILSYVKVGVGGLVVLSYVKKDDALIALQQLLTKSVLFFIAIISFSFLISMLASSQLTSALRSLLWASQKVAQGDYNIDINVKTKDEVGKLADSFNFMATEVSRLMSENVEKARMEKELETAKAVQDALFPPTEAKIGKVEVCGFYKSASECGGDWWHYCELGNKVFLWIGDATGHGAPAALITSAAKSVASVVETIPNVSPAEAMSMLNTSICKNSKGKICMTFFIASLDQETGEFKYCNASHEPPIKIPAKDGPVKKMDLEPIMGTSYARLGEKLESEYVDEVIQLEQGDSVYFYTDGVTELVGPDGSMFEERRLLRSIVSGFKKGEGIKGVMGKIDTDLEEFRETTPYEDDVTYFMARFG